MGLSRFNSLGAVGALLKEEDGVKDSVGVKEGVKEDLEDLEKDE